MESAALHWIYTMFDITKELDYYNLKYEVKPKYIQTICPFHEDTNPSLAVYQASNKFNCWVCKASGDLVILLTKLRNTSITETRKYLQQEYRISFRGTLDARLIEDYHKELWYQKALLQQLDIRAITPEIISKYRLGSYNGRITIPIPNELGQWINVRYYLPGAKENKIFSRTKCGKNTLYPFEQINYERIVLTGGEIKALAGLNVLNACNIGCISATGGEGSFDATWIKHFQNKEVYVCFDVDDPGRMASQKICRYLYRYVKAVYDVILPMDTSKYPKGGLDDFLYEKGNIAEVLTTTTAFNPEDIKVEDFAEQVQLKEVFDSDKVGQKVEFSGILACVNENVYAIPKTLNITCNKEQDFCSLCPRVHPSKDGVFSIEPGDASVLAFINSSKREHDSIIREALQIPHNCRVWRANTLEYYAAEKIRISPKLTINNRDTEKSMQPAIVLKTSSESPELDMGNSYTFIGKAWPDPRSQISTVVVSEYIPEQDALSSYECTNIEELRVFQPKEWSLDSLTEKITEIYADFESNVTHILRRREIHTVVDLCYHSPLFISFQGQVCHGWVNGYIIGDTTQGKSETAHRLLEHYQLGERIDAESTTAAGLLGGTQQLGSGEWFVTWGVIPSNDKRLVILDEAEKIAQKGLIEVIRDARTSGVAQITKIKQRKTHCRTRLLFISNPSHSRSMGSYNYGINAVTDVIGAPQDIRRFDVIISVHNNEVNMEDMLYPAQTEHIYTSDLCHELLLWTWTRDNVIFEDEDYIIKRAIALTDDFAEEFPLLDRGSTRFKLARLAASMAARTFSTEDGSSIIVRKCHVDWVEKFLYDMYSKPKFGYFDFSQQIKSSNQIKNGANVLRMVNGLEFPEDFAEQMLNLNTIDVWAINDIAGFSERSQGQNILSILLRNNCLKKGAKGYHKTPAFTELLKSWLSKGLVAKPQERFTL